MRYVSIELNGKPALGVRNGQGDIDVVGNESLETLLANGTDLTAWGKGRPVQQTVKQADARFLPPLPRPTKIICVGLNYADHTAESPYEQPDYPTLFLRL